MRPYVRGGTHALKTNMQSPYRAILLSLFVLAALPACYRHVGSPYGGHDPGWHRAAVEACERGDEPAFRALIARSEEEVECPLFSDTAGE